MLNENKVPAIFEQTPLDEEQYQIQQDSVSLGNDSSSQTQNEKNSLLEEIEADMKEASVVEENSNSAKEESLEEEKKEQLDAYDEPMSLSVNDGDSKSENDSVYQNLDSSVEVPSNPAKYRPALSE